VALDIQKLFDAISETARNERSKYHLTLGEMIEHLSSADGSSVVMYDDGKSPGRARSYRGYYSDLSFADAAQPVTVAELLDECREALGSTFEGYKGGDFVMGWDTPLWRSEWGAVSGLAIGGAVSVAGQVGLVTKAVD
jgi:hypothetical protein